jgi:hypothetical protein
VARRGEAEEGATRNDLAHEPRRGSRRGRDASDMLVGCGRVRAHLAGGGVALACALASSAREAPWPYY